MFRSQSNRLPFLRGCEFVPTGGLQFQMRKMEHLYCLGSLPRFPMICPLSRRHSVTRKPQISFDSAGKRPEILCFPNILLPFRHWGFRIDFEVERQPFMRDFEQAMTPDLRAFGVQQHPRYSNLSASGTNKRRKFICCHASIYLLAIILRFATGCKLRLPATFVRCREYRPYAVQSHSDRV